jgi:hypothetical protein
MCTGAKQKPAVIARAPGHVGVWVLCSTACCASTYRVSSGIYILTRTVKVDRDISCIQCVTDGIAETITGSEKMKSHYLSAARSIFSTGQKAETALATRAGAANEFRKIVVTAQKIDRKPVRLP